MNATLSLLLRHLGRAIEPLSSALSDPRQALALLADLGIAVRVTPASLTALGPRIDATLSALTALEGIADWGSLEALEKTLVLAGRMQALFEAVQALVPELQAEIEALPELAALDVSDFAERLTGLLLVRYLDETLPPLAASLRLFGIIEVREIDAVPQIAGDAEEDAFAAPSRLDCRLRLDRLKSWVDAPTGTAGALYGWATPRLDGDALLTALYRLLQSFGLDAALYRADDAALSLAAIGDPEAAAPELRAPVFRDAGVDGRIEFGLGLLPVPESAGNSDGGLLLRPYLAGAATVDVSLLPDLHLGLDAGLGAAGGVALLMRPAPAGLSLVTAAGVAARLAATLRYAHADGSSIEIGGQPGLFAVGAEAVELRASAALDAKGLEVLGEFAILGGNVHFGFGDADSFLGKILPSEGLTIPLELAVLWSNRTGLSVKGGAGLDLDITVGLSFFGGVLRVDRLHLRVDAGTEGLRLQAAAVLGSEIGPLAVTVSELGLTAALALAPRGGNLGVADLSFSFKPPTGIGLSIDTSTVTAGGFLSIDVDRGRYVGAIELSVLNKFDLAAIGIITTKKPDGSPGFSLLFLISMTLPVAVPLGYNFFFAGAGGLLGLNRGVDTDHLREGLRTGTADNILFPTDVVRRIDAIVLDLDASFPQTDGQFLVGPMALITWSTPPLISVKLGLIIEIGSPVRVAILGVLRAALPDTSDPVLDLKVAFLGTVDVQAQLISFDAAIFDSYIGRGSFKLLIEGDMALRVSWGRQPDFVTSIGGFHPNYTPQAHLHLPAMRRLSLSLLKDNPRLSLSLYLAVTSNTVQCGARLDFYFKVSSFSVVGDFGFDVLFQFSPFHLDAHVYAGLAVRSGDTDILSLQLDFNLLGPNPWIARGTASFKVLFFKVAVQFEKRFGEDETKTLPDVEVLPQLIAQLQRNENWRAELDTSVQTGILPKPVAPAAGTVVVDAAGRLTVGQRILPLDTDFSLFGTSRPSDARRVRVKSLRIGGVAVAVDAVEDDFSPAAFRAMSDADKLAAAPFERRPSGVRASVGQQLVGDLVVERPVAYETIVSDAASGVPPAAGVHVAETDGTTFRRLLSGGAAGRSAAARALARQAEAGKVLGLGEARERFAVASNRDLRPLAADGRPATATAHDANGVPVYAPGTLIRRSEAERRRDELLRRGFDADELEIIPEAQLAA